MQPEATWSTCWRARAGLVATSPSIGGGCERPGVAQGWPEGRQEAPEPSAGAAAEPPGSTAEHREEPNGGDAEGRRREGEANASRNRRNRLLEKARHVSRRDTAD